jgi:hypothetical protein
MNICIAALRGHIKTGLKKMSYIKVKIIFRFGKTFLYLPFDEIIE